MSAAPRTPKPAATLRAELAALRKNHSVRGDLADLIAEVIEVIETMQQAIETLQRAKNRNGPLKDDVPWLGAPTPAEQALIEYQAEGRA